MLSGNLSDWSVADLLQMMRVTSKTAALRIEGARAGVIHFQEGKLAAATLAGQPPPADVDQLRRATIDTLFVLTGPTEGSFFVASPEIDPDAPSWDVTEIMEEVQRLRVIEGALDFAVLVTVDERVAVERVGNDESGVFASLRVRILGVLR